MKLVSRGDTTVVDAYLSPILRRYVDQVGGQLDADEQAGPRLMFMQSNGGLTDARLFQGKDAILSGPAGGVVGMVRTAATGGSEKLHGLARNGVVLGKSVLVRVVTDARRIIQTKKKDKNQKN